MFNIKGLKMAKIIIARSITDEKLFKIKNHVIDIVPSHTMIYNKNGFTRCRITDKVESIDIDANRTRVNYQSGNYLLIIP